MANRTRESARTTCTGSAPRWRFGLVFGVVFPENTRGHNMKTQQRRTRWGAKGPAGPHANTGNRRCHCSTQTTHLSHLGLNAEPVIASKPGNLNHLKNFPLFLSPAGFFRSASHLVEGERFFTPCAQGGFRRTGGGIRGGVNVADENWHLSQRSKAMKIHFWQSTRRSGRPAVAAERYDKPNDGTAVVDHGGHNLSGLGSLRAHWPCRHQELADGRDDSGHPGDCSGAGRKPLRLELGRPKRIL